MLPPDAFRKLIVTKMIIKIIPAQSKVFASVIYENWALSQFCKSKLPNRINPIAPKNNEMKIKFSCM